MNLNVNTLDNVLLTTERGNELFEHNGRLWHRHHMSGSPYSSSDGTKHTTYLDCHGTGCQARLALIQNANPNTGEVVGPATFNQINDNHISTCNADVAVIVRLKGRKLVEDLVRNGQRMSDAVGEVKSIIRQKLGDDEASLFETTFQLKRRINQNISRSNGHSPSTFEALQNIPQELTVTRNNEPFLLVYKDYIDENGTLNGVILVFATTSDLVKLFDAKVVLIDGTFKIKPAPFNQVRGAQVFTVNTFIGVSPSKRMQRRLLGLLPSKSEHCYWTFWRLTLEAAMHSRGIDISAPPHVIKWKELMCDFEIGMQNAFLSIAHVLGLPLILLACCHTHYCSAIFKKMKELGLGPAYQNEDSGWRFIMSLLFALAFLPADLIPSMYAYIRDCILIEEMHENDAVVHFLMYYESTWIDNPVIPVQSWSVFDRDDESKRTSNDLEGKHW